jgi:hypothetical protein
MDGSNNLGPHAASRQLTVRELATIRVALRGWTVLGRRHDEVIDAGLAEVGDLPILSDQQIERFLVDLAGVGDVVITPLNPPDARSAARVSPLHFLEHVTRYRKDLRRLSTRRMWSLDRLPLPRAYFRGPMWKRLCGVHETPIADIDADAAKLHRPGRKLLIFSFEDEVRERVLQPVRHDVVAGWSDPREQLGLR